VQLNKMACILLSVMNALTVQTKNSSQCQFALFFSDKICESFVGYYELLTKESAISDCKLDPALLRGQVYDGASKCLENTKDVQH